MNPISIQISKDPLPWWESGARRLAAGALAYVAFVMAARFYNRQADAVWGAVCLSIGLGALRLVSHRDAYRCLRFNRAGWSLAVSWLLGGLALFHLGLFAVFRIRLGAMVLLPELASACSFLVEQAVWFAPLALVEELFFRAWLQETMLAALWREGCWGFVSRKNLATALLFGLAHWAALGQPAGLMTILPGLLLGWVVERSRGSIWPAVGLHLGLNLLLVWSRQLVLMNSPWL